MNFIKKTAALFAAATVTVFSLTAFSVFADDEISDEDTYMTSAEIIASGDYGYSVKTGNYGDEIAVIEQYNGNDTDVVIPETIDGFKVEALGNSTFAGNDRLKTITIPSGLEDFGVYTFYGCTSVTEYKVNEKNEIYKADEDGAIVGIHGLSIVAYPAGKKPESYTVPNGVVYISASAFAMCENLKEITFPDTLKKIDDFAFSECTSLKEIVMPDSLESLGIAAFSGCTSLSRIEFSQNLVSIGNGAFHSCESLESIPAIPPSLREIGQAAFCATGLTSVSIPSTVANVGDSAFGFSTDYTGQIIQESNFVVQGYDNTAAQMYCSENGVTFLSLGSAENDPARKTEQDKSGMAPGLIAAICAASAVIIAVIVIIIIKFVRKRNNNDESDDNDDEEDIGDYAEDDE